MEEILHHPWGLIWLLARPWITIVTFYLSWDSDDWSCGTPELTQQHVPVGAHGSLLPPPSAHGLLLCVPKCFSSNELISVLCFLSESPHTWLRSNYCSYVAHKTVEIISWVQWPPLQWLLPSSESGTYKMCLPGQRVSPKYHCLKRLPNGLKIQLEAVVHI